MSYADFLQRKQLVWSESVFIYGLFDPRTDELRYIGKSIRPRERLANHMNDRSVCHRTNWLRELRASGVRPRLGILAMMPRSADWQTEERRQIAVAKADGCALVNGTSGGDGVCGLSDESKAKMRRTWLGRKHTPETLAKLRAARAVRVTSAETRAKMSRSQSGRTFRPEWLAKIAAANRKLPADTARAIAARLAAGETVCALAREYGVHRTTLSKIKMGRYLK